MNTDIPRVIGLSGFAQTGKTTAAEFIQMNYGHKRKHIAEPLRDMLRTLLKWAGVSADRIERYLTGDLKESLIPELGVTSRRAQITLGTEWGRNLVDDDIWVDIWVNDIMFGDRVQNDSVRFPNEEHGIRRLGGMTILIMRKGVGPAAWRWKHVGPLLYRWFGCMWGVHDSERIDRLNPDVVIHNDGSVADLMCMIDRALHHGPKRDPLAAPLHLRPLPCA